MLAKHCLQEFKLDCNLRRFSERIIKRYYKRYKKKKAHHWAVRNLSVRLITRCLIWYAKYTLGDVGHGTNSRTSNGASSYVSKENDNTYSTDIQYKWKSLWHSKYGTTNGAKNSSRVSEPPGPEGLSEGNTPTASAVHTFLPYNIIYSWSKSMSAVIQINRISVLK